MPARKRRPSLLGGLLWVSVGIVLLLHNLGMVPDVWALAGRYWPVLLILLGLGKVLDYYLRKDSVSIRVGEVICIILLLLVGSFITKIFERQIGTIFRDIPIGIGDISVSPGQWLGDSYTYSEEGVFSLDPEATIRIENSYGGVSVSPGSDREVRIHLKKIVYSSNESRAKDIASEISIETRHEVNNVAPASLKSAAEAETALKKAIFVAKTNREALSSREYRFKTDMEVFVPSNSQLEIQNLFGEVRVANIDGKLGLSTTHYPLEVRDCSGEFIVSNRYAESRLMNLVGNLTVDARGPVHLGNIKGEVSVSNEFSPVEIAEVDGKVTVSNTESSITIEKVSQPVVINARGSRLRVSNLQDSLNVTASHQQVDISQVASSVSLESSFSTLTLKNIQGSVDVHSNYDRVTADDIHGHLDLRGKGSSIRVNRIEGPLDIQTTHNDVTVNNFSAACNIVNEYGDVSLFTRTLGEGAVNVRNRNGSIDLFLPLGVAFEIEAIARNGRIETYYPDLESSQSAGSIAVLKDRVKKGGPKIILETEYDNIRIRSRGSVSDQGPREEQVMVNENVE